MEAIEREGPVTGAATMRRGHALLDSERWLGKLMIAPAILYVVLVVGVPFFLALYYSMSDVTLGSQTVLTFVGLKHFAAVIGTPKFRTAVWNTFVFAFVSQALVLVLANILALALVKDFPGKWVVRFLILLPWVAPISLGTIGWLWILDSIYSVVNWSLRAIGIFGPNTWPMWLGVPSLAMGSIIVIHVWRLLPLATVILLAGLGSIPRDIDDASASSSPSPT
jgi:multiple sugar transport system permease protein